MINPEEHLTICDQRRAILDGAGHMLIRGGPGSGKTTIALLKARRTVLEGLQPGQSVLFLSFSNAAIRRILESAGNILTAETRRQVEIKTYHSFAWGILRSHGYLLSSQRQLKIITEQDAAVRRAGLKYFDWIVEEERLFQEDGLVTYDQFAPRAADLLERSAVIRRRFCHAHPLILVDEFQDTDEDQWRLIRILSKNSKVIALGDAEQRIYTWRKGVSATRLDDFAETPDVAVFDFANENNRSPATGIAGYARSLLSPEIRLDLPDDIEFKRFLPGRFNVGLRFAFIKTWGEAVKRAGHRKISVAVAGYSHVMVRQISDALQQKLAVRGREFPPIFHDVMFDQTRIILAARVVAFVMASQTDPLSDRNNRLANTLERISAVFRSSGKTTLIQKSDRLLTWASKCRDGKVPTTKCVTALNVAFDALNASNFSGSPIEDWLLVRQTLEQTEASELKQVTNYARYLRLFRRGPMIEGQLAELWQRSGNYVGAEDALNRAILHEQLTGNHRETSGVSVMTMHKLKGREYDAVLLVEDQYRTFRGRDDKPPFMETRRLLQVSLTRARYFAFILSGKNGATLDMIFPSSRPS